MSNTYLLILRGMLSFVLLGTIAFPGVQMFAAETYVIGEIEEAPTVRFTPENWFTLPHPKIATFTVEADGNMYGVTDNGIPFRQYTISNTVGIRVQRFEIDDHYHYIVDGVPVYSFETLSIELALAYNKEALHV